MRRAILSAMLAWAAMALPGHGWELIKRDDSATTLQRQGDYLMSLSCRRGRGEVEFALNDDSLRGDAFIGVETLAMRVIAPDGGAETWSIAVGMEGPSLTGPVRATAQMLDAFGNGESLTLEDPARRRVLFRSEMKGTGAARIAFRERCGI